jgi:hypothetical protein
MGGSLFEHTPLIENIGPITDAQRFAHIVISDQYANALSPQLQDNPLNIYHRQRVNTGKRLVEEHERWGDHQCSGDLYPPAFSAGKGVRLMPGEMGDVELGQQLSKPRPSLGSGEWQRLQDGSKFSSTVSLRKIDGSCGR